MAYKGRSNFRDNFNRWQSKSTANLKKVLMQEAEKYCVDITKAVAERLEKVHKGNVLASYYPRASEEQAKKQYNESQRQLETKYNEDKAKEDKKRFRRQTLSYKHTGTLLEAIHGVPEKKSRFEGRAVIEIEPKPYEEDHPRKDSTRITAQTVYEWLREGTRGGGEYWFKNEKGGRPDASNYSTPAHLFELHTKIQMKEYLETLDVRQLAKNRRYRIK